MKQISLPKWTIRYRGVALCQLPTLLISGAFACLESPQNEDSAFSFKGATCTVRRLGPSSADDRSGAGMLQSDAAFISGD
jgi:hypothetical protein